MLWKGRRQSSNVEDRRGRSTKVMVGGGIGTIILALAIYFLGGDPTQLLNNTQLNDSQTTAPYQGTAEVIFPRFLGHSVKLGCHSLQLKRYR
jgi:predicted metalloprotease